MYKSVINVFAYINVATPNYIHTYLIYLCNLWIILFDIIMYVHKLYICIHLYVHTYRVCTYVTDNSGYIHRVKMSCHRIK